MQQTFTYSYDRDTVTKTVREPERLAGAETDCAPVQPRKGEGAERRRPNQQGSGANEAAWVYAYDAQGQLLSAARI